MAQDGVRLRFIQYRVYLKKIPKLKSPCIKVHTWSPELVIIIQLFLNWEPMQDESGDHNLDKRQLTKYSTLFLSRSFFLCKSLLLVCVYSIKYPFQNRRAVSVFRITLDRNMLETCGFHHWKEKTVARRSMLEIMN